MTPLKKLLPATVALGLASVAVAGCASANKTTGANASDTSSSSSSGSMGGMSQSAGSVAGASSKMSMTSGTTTVVNSKGIPVPVPIRTIATGTWKQMRIMAQETTPVPFYVDNGGSSYSEVKPGKASFHLMVMLNDKTTGVALPYFTVWATIYHNGKIVSNAPQWDMLSEYMGPHYGNDITLPGPGTYTLKLLISPPKAALHVEYANMWTSTHTLTAQFHWAGKVSTATAG